VVALSGLARKTSQVLPDCVANATEHGELRRFDPSRHNLAVKAQSSSVRAYPESEVIRDSSVRLAELAGSDQAFN
jgi:hypothetical protein